MVIVYAPDHRPVARIPVPHAERSGWMLRGACRTEDPELFFPISAAGPGLAQVSSAKAVCGRCPVRANCLSYALITRPDGIWGGTTREERWASLPPAKCHEDRFPGTRPLTYVADGHAAAGAGYCAVMAGLSRMSRPGSVSSSSATASRDFTKSEKER
jgi:WhiB family redox-sensing transcriptional regulator